MHVLVLVLLGFHALSAVFWAGTTIVLGRGVAPSSPLVRSQLGAAVGAIASGAALWFLFHRGSAHGSADPVLAAGALAALVGAVLQAAIVVPATRRMAHATDSGLARLQTRVAQGQRVAAPLLMIGLVCMVVARYV